MVKNFLNIKYTLLINEIIDLNETFIQNYDIKINNFQILNLY